MQKKISIFGLIFVLFISLLESTAHLVKGCLGAGILGMHEAYMYGGIWTSLGVTATIGFLVPYCMLASLLVYFILVLVLLIILGLVFINFS